MNAEIVDRIGGLVGYRVIGARRAAGGYTAAERWICSFENGASAFAKIGPACR